jgi:hypothetical protein
MKLYAAILMAGLLVAAAASADYLGKVTAVVDGDRKELVIVHPADFVSWTERDFRISPQSIRRTFARTPKP